MPGWSSDAINKGLDRTWYTGCEILCLGIDDWEYTKAPYSEAFVLPTSYEMIEVDDLGNMRLYLGNDRRP
jgi:hypothetical protein